MTDLKWAKLIEAFQIIIQHMRITLPTRKIIITGLQALLNTEKEKWEILKALMQDLLTLPLVHHLENKQLRSRTTWTPQVTLNLSLEINHQFKALNWETDRQVVHNGCHLMLNKRKEKREWLITNIITDKITSESFPIISKILELKSKTINLNLSSLIDKMKVVKLKTKLNKTLETILTMEVPEAISEEVSITDQTNQTSKEDLSADLL